MPLSVIEVTNSRPRESKARLSSPGFIEATSFLALLVRLMLQMPPVPVSTT